MKKLIITNIRIFKKLFKNGSLIGKKTTEAKGSKQDFLLK